MRKDDAGGVESVQRALELLRLIAADGAVRLSDAARELGLAHSTAHRLLATLQRQGYVSRDRGGRRYVPGPALLDLGVLVADDAVKEAAQAGLHEVTTTFGETAHLLVLRRTTAHYLAGMESRRGLRVGLRVGRTLPAHCSSGGKALLAELADETIEVLYPDEELRKETPSSLATRTELFAEIAEIRERGYAVNDGESEEGIVAISATIIDTDGRARGALVMAAPSGRVAADDIPYIGTAIRDVAARVGAALGH